MVAKVTNNIINGRRLKNNGDGNIMRGGGARDGNARGQAEVMGGCQNGAC